MGKLGYTKAISFISCYLYMPKRRVSLQQARQIKIQQHKKLNSTDKSGLVISRLGHHVEIETTDNHIITCYLRTHLNSVVAGDKVSWQPLNATQGVITSIFPRISVLEKKDMRGQAKAVAANVTQLLIVLAPRPLPSWLLLDSYLVMADYLNLDVAIVLNKTDLPLSETQTWLDTYYKPLGYPILSTAFNQPLSDEFLATLNAHTSVFIGQSGVGKSSLISRLIPHYQPIAIGSLSTQSQLGKHTTSYSRLYHLAQGGQVIDSPGVREFTLGPMSRAHIIQGFRECAKLAHLCRFRNCAHDSNTPGCALIQAIEEEKLAPSRLMHLQQLLATYGIKP
tara:strand:- start:410 stop:1420 length:1011 start_codon:yes stop_codon:yes gene_type:complete